MAEDFTAGIRLKPSEDSSSTANNSIFLPEDFPGVSFIDATPTVEDEDVTVRTREQVTQTEDEVSTRRIKEQATQTNSEGLDEKKPGGKNLVVCIDGTANQFGLKVRPVSIDAA